MIANVKAVMALADGAVVQDHSHAVWQVEEWVSEVSGEPAVERLWFTVGQVGGISDEELWDLGPLMVLVRRFRYRESA